MSAPRRVVTGEDAAGQSVVVSDGPVAGYYELASRGGLSLAAVFELAVPPEVAGDGGDSAEELTLVPGPGMARVIRTVHPPERLVEGHAGGGPAPDGTADRARYFDPSRGEHMHATPTIDVLVVASGRIDLLLDTERVHLEAGDSVVQRATWHSWANPYDEPCVMVGINFALPD